MIEQTLENFAKADTKNLDEEKKALASTGKAKTAAEGGLTRTVKDLANATATLETVNSDCAQTQVIVMRP